MAITPVAQAYNSPVNFYLSQTPPTDIKDPLAQEAVTELYNALQNIIQTLINFCGIGPQSAALWLQLAGTPGTLQAGNLNRLYVTASELVPLGAMINLFNSAGVLKVRNANATTNAKPADGYCTTAGGIALGAVGEVQLGHGVVSLVGVTIGQRYWLSVVNGLITTVAPVAAGNIEQYIGIGIDANSVFVNTSYYIQH